MTVNYSTKPHHLQVLLGYPVGVSSSETFAGGARLFQRPSPTGVLLPPLLGTAAAPLKGYILNQGTTSFTLAIHQSNDNAIADPYVAINMRVAGAAVASVVVAPGAHVEFTLETVTEPFLKVHIPATSAPFGACTFVYGIDEMNQVYLGL